MAESTTRSVRAQDEQLVRRMAILVVFWTSMFLLASAGLVRYGDVLANVFA